MRTTIDIPDDIYRELKVKAAQEGTTVRTVMLRGVRSELGQAATRPQQKRFQVPVIRSARPGTLHLTNERIDELLTP